MNDPRGDVPHFLRVVRALARVSGPTVPLAVIVTVVSSCASTCKSKNGFTVMEDAGEIGAGGAAGDGRHRGESPSGGGGGQGGQSTTGGSGGGYGGASTTDGSTGGSGGGYGGARTTDGSTGGSGGGYGGTEEVPDAG